MDRKKFDHPGMEELRQSPCSGEWKKQLLLNKVKHKEEVPLFQEAGIEVFSLRGCRFRYGQRGQHY
jgi:hypothetical protein